MTTLDMFLVNLSNIFAFTKCPSAHLTELIKKSHIICFTFQHKLYNLVSFDLKCNK